MALWMTSFVFLVGAPEPQQWPVVWPPIVATVESWPPAASRQDEPITPSEDEPRRCLEGVCTTERPVRPPTVKRVQRRPFLGRFFQRLRRR